MQITKTSESLKGILQIHSEGIAVEDLQCQFEGGDQSFWLTADDLWSDGYLTGVVSEGCCENICMQHCIAYMNDRFQWKLSKKL